MKRTRQCVTRVDCAGCAQHWQMILSRHCPLVQRELSWFQRVLYCSGVWNYLVGGITTPLFIILPIITIFGGIFPIVISWWAAGAWPYSPNEAQGSGSGSVPPPASLFHCRCAALAFMEDEGVYNSGVTYFRHMSPLAGGVIAV